MLYRFEGAENGLLKDHSGHQRHGKLVGGRWVLPEGAVAGFIDSPVRLANAYRWQLIRTWSRGQVAQYHPKEHLLAVGHANHGVRIYDGTDYRLVAVVPDVSKSRLVWNLDEAKLSLSTWGHRNNAQVWDIARRKRLAMLQDSTDPIFRGIWSPTENRIASVSYWSGDSTIRISDADGNYLTHLDLGSDARGVKVFWSADGACLGAISDTLPVKVWRMDDEPTPLLDLDAENVLSVQWSPDGEIIACGRDGFGQPGIPKVKLFDAQAGRLIAELASDSVHWANDVKFSPGGKRLAYGTHSAEAGIYDITSRQLHLRRWPGDGKGVTNVSWRNEHELIIATDTGALELWEFSTGKSRALGRFAPVVNTVWLSEDGGKLMVMADSRSLRSIDVRQRKIIQSSDLPEAPSTGVSIDRTGQWVVRRISQWIAGDIRNDQLEIWSKERGERQQTVQIAGDEITTFVLSPTGEEVAVGSKGGKVAIFGFSGAEPRWVINDLGSVRRLAWSRDGQQIAIAAQGGPGRRLSRSRLTVTYLGRIDREEHRFQRSGRLPRVARS